jgi:hypothetical protein
MSTGKIRILSLSLTSVRKNASLVKTATKLVSDRDLPPSSDETNSTLKSLVKSHSTTGKKLLALGTALLIMPDPITDAAAVPVLIAGKFLQSRQSANIKDVFDEARNALAAISSVSFR